MPGRLHVNAEVTVDDVQRRSNCISTSSNGLNFDALSHIEIEIIIHQIEQNVKAARGRKDLRTIFFILVLQANPYSNLVLIYK